MIRKFAFVAIATAAIAGSHIGTTNAANAANAAPPSFLGGSYGIARMDSAEKTIYVGSANGGVWKSTDGGPSNIAFDGQSEEPHELLVPAVQKVRCASSRNC
jgi:hypothetical protein